jgi:hypothetical protein
MMAEDRRDVGLLAVTSADRLNAGWTAPSRARDRGLIHARSHVERLFADLPPHCAIITVTMATRPRSAGWFRSTAIARAALVPSISASRGRLATSTVTSASTRIRSSRPAMASRPDGRCAVCARWIESCAVRSRRASGLYGCRAGLQSSEKCGDHRRISGDQ